MIIIPRENPVIENLNSYYLDIRKLFEHYQGEFSAGGIHFKSPSAEGVIFFDKDELLTGVFQDKERNIDGKSAIDLLMEAIVDHNFTINIYKIDIEKIYFWANIPNAKKVYEDLSTEFTDLEGLIKKMGIEKLTGYIDVSIDNGNEGGLIFFDNGNVIGGSFSWGEGKVKHSKEDQRILIQKAKESGGTFNVSRISLTKRNLKNETKETNEEFSSNVLSTLEEILGTFEGIVASKKKIKSDFRTLLKKKFVEKANEYDFLDPFAAEFEYSDHKISFVGNASAEDLTKGITDSVKELAVELGVLPQLINKLDPWFQKHSEELTGYGISF